MVWPSDRDENISMQFLLLASFFFDSEGKARKYVKKYYSPEHILNDTFIAYVPDILLIPTVRRCYDKLGILIKTTIEVFPALDNS